MCLTNGSIASIMPCTVNQIDVNVKRFVSFFELAVKLKNGGASYRDSGSALRLQTLIILTDLVPYS